MRKIAAGCVAACLSLGLGLGAGLSALPSAQAAGVNEGPKELAHGLRYIKAGDFPRAIVHLTAAIETRQLEPKRLSDAYYFRGRALTRAQHPDLALADFSQAVLYWPENTKALRVRCRALTIKGNLEKAATDCDQAILLAPDDWRGWFTRGLMFDAGQKRDQARDDFAKAQQRMPDGMEASPIVARQFREYGLMKEETPPPADTSPPGGNTLPVWSAD